MQYDGAAPISSYISLRVLRVIELADIVAHSASIENEWGAASCLSISLKASGFMMSREKKS